MATTGSIPRFSHPASPDQDDCDLAELQCDCDEPAVRRIVYTENYERLCYLTCNLREGCTLYIREDLLNKYATQMVNYCTAASNSSLHDALDSSVYLINKMEEDFLQLENKFDYVSSQLSEYKKQHTARDKAHDRRLEDEKCKSRKYCKLFWFMVILYVARFLIPTL